MKTATKKSPSVSTSKRTVTAKKPLKRETTVVKDNTSTEGKTLKKRFVLCQFDPNEHKLVGTYLDLDHASNVTGLSQKDIQADIEEGSEMTGSVWVKSPVGKTVNHRIINKYARERYKKIKTVSRGRRPIKREDALKDVKNISIEMLDDASLKKLARILKNAQSR